jgi:putative DNA primase/helicase
MPQDSLDASAARSAVREDLTALEAIPKSNPERVFAAETIGRNARTQLNYADELAKPEATSSAVFLEVQAAVAEMDRRASVRENRNVSTPRESGSAEREEQARHQARPNQIERISGREVSAAAPESAGPARDRLVAARARDRAGATAPATGTGNDGAVSERFITALDRRLEKSELEELGWKGREDLNDVMRDLRKLAEADFQRASALWSKYRPDDKDKPAFLDNDEFAEAKRRSASTTGTKGADEKVEFITPDQIRKRFIQADNRYYFRHDDNKLAFEDRGNKIATDHNDPMVALSMVQMAEAKGWQSIRLRGSDEFKREAWLQASLKGIEAKGYEPRDVDAKKLAEMQKELGTTPVTLRNIVERQAEPEGAASPIGARREKASVGEGVDRTSVVDEPQRSLTPSQRLVLDTVKAAWRQNGASDKEVATAAAATVERFQNQRVYVGKVVERGEAPFENDPKNEKSFYLKLDTPKGEKTVWGVDLKRALRESAIRDGDDVVVANQGRKPVQVTVRDRDESGKVVGMSAITTNRNTWRVETLDSLREEALEQIKVKAAQADRAPLIPVHDRNAERADPRPDVTIEKKRDQERSR